MIGRSVSGPSGFGGGHPNLRPMGAGEILDSAVRLYRDNWQLYIAMSAVILIPVALVQAVVVSSLIGAVSGNPLRAISFVVSIQLFAVAVFVSIVVGGFLTAAFAWATAQIYLGRVPSLQEAFSAAFRKIGSVLWVLFLGGLFVGMGLLLLFPGIYLAIRLLLAPGVVVIEGRKGMAALKRSWELTGGSFWRLFGIFLLTVIIVAIVAIIIQIPLSLILRILPFGALIAGGLVSGLASVITRPFVYIVDILLYFDLRVRKEGFDLELMARNVGSF